MEDLEDLPYSAYPLSEYKKGAIVSLVLENFMKHQDGEFRATPGLNFIFGLNGSGKSSIVCALILGLGGDPKITGRCSKLSQYVTRGMPHALIKIELSNGDSENTTVFERKIIINTETHGTSNEFRVDRKRLSQEDYKTQVSKFNIKVDNLCQVLPQERVAEFSGLNSQQLLLSTEMSIGDVELYNDHMKLIDADKIIADTNTKIERTEAQILQYKGFKHALEPSIEKINEAGKYQKEIETLEKKIAYLNFQTTRDTYINLKDVFTRHKDELKSIREKANEAKKQFQRTDRILTDYDQKISEQKKVCESFVNFCGRIDSSNRDYRNERTKIFLKYRDNQKNLKKELLKLENLDEEIEREKERLEQFNQQSENTEERLRDLENSIQELDLSKNQIRELEEQKHKIRLETGSAKRTIESFHRNVNEVYEKFFKKSTIEANRIFLQNKKNENFEGEVYNILITHIHLKKQEYAKFFENAIPGRDWELFLFEKESDLRRFREILPENIKVAMALVGEVTSDLLETSFEVSKFESHGIYASLHNLYDAPRLVKAYLNKTAKLNLLPIGNQNSHKHTDELCKYKFFRMLYTSDNIYRFIRSRFQTDVVSIITEQWPNVRILNELKRIDPSIVKRCDQIIENCRVKLSEVEELIAKGNDRNSQIDQKLKEMKTEKAYLEKTFKEKKAYEQTIREKLKDKSLLEKNINKMKSIGIENEMPKLEELSKNHTNLIKKFLIALDKNSHSLQERFILCEEHSIVEPVKIHFQNEHIRNDRYYKDREEVLQKMKTDMDKAKVECSELLEVACEKTNLPLRNYDDSRVIELLKKFEDYPESIDEIEMSIATYQQKCDPYRAANQQSLKDYQEYTSKIKTEEESLIELRNKIDSAKLHISTIKDGWITRLKTIVGKIDKNYSCFMERLGYQGTVCLSNINEDKKFENCGISIRVKFRENATFSDLQSHSQSGGERSVATVVYMLALQEQAVVPFRIIDEINQGMDANNERNVFGLFDHVSKTNQSQYFLLTPKLISGLEYTPQMSVINILAFGKLNNKENS